MIYFAAVQCPPPAVVSHGILLSSVTTYHYRDIIKYQCQQGYKLSGKPTNIKYGIKNFETAYFPKNVAHFWISGRGFKIAC